MINLICGKDPVELGIKSYDGWNISRFLDHLDSCDKCREEKGTLINELNNLIGGEQE